MNNPNQITSRETSDEARQTGWEGVASMANKYPTQREMVDPSKFEKPSDDFDTIASAVV